MTNVDTMEDPALFGRWFPGVSWNGWKTAVSVVEGKPPIGEDGARLYRQCTGRTIAPTSPVREAWFIVGRRGGKSRIAALVAVYLAAFRDYRHVLAPGEVGTLAVIAADRRQARVVMRYIRAFLEVPMLRQLVAAETKESIELANRVVIEVHTASFRAVRGYTLIGVIADEIAFWNTDDNAADPDREILNGLRPGLATTGGLLLAISSPYARKGELWRNYREHFGKDGDPVLVWQADTRTMNPAVDQRVIDDAYADDEARASAEYGAEFRRDIESFVSREAVEAVVILGRRELPPHANTSMVAPRYKCFVDPSGGSVDSFAAAIGHLEKGKAVLDCLVEVRAPFNPREATDQIAQVLRQYRITKIVGDRYGGEFPRSLFKEQGITYEPSELNKSELYSEFLPSINSGRVELLDHPRLIAQLLGLERRTSRMGRDSIDHAPGGHDDVANAVAGVLLLCRPPVTPIARANERCPASYIPTTVGRWG
jgi:hypothetical protein